MQVSKYDLITKSGNVSSIKRCRSSVKRDIHVVGGRSSPIIWLSFQLAWFPVVELEYAERMTSCGMVSNVVAVLIKFQQYMSIDGLKVSARSFDNDFNYCKFFVVQK